MSINEQAIDEILKTVDHIAYMAEIDNGDAVAAGRLRIQQRLDALRAQPAPDEQAAGQWRMAPVEPDETMLRAGIKAFQHAYSSDDPLADWRAFWIAAMTAAPHPPAQRAQAEAVAWWQKFDDLPWAPPRLFLASDFDPRKSAWAPGVTHRPLVFGDATPQQAAGQAAELEYPPSSEGTVRCTCSEYPHANGCGSMIGQRGWEAGYAYAMATEVAGQPQRGAGEGLVPKLTDEQRIDYLCDAAVYTCGQWQVVIESDNPSFIDAFDEHAERAHGIRPAGSEGEAS